MDFIDVTPIKEGRSRQLKQLDALVKVGLLQKNPVEIEKDGIKTKAVRYGLTDKGWGATLEATSGNRPNYCFVYGALRYLGVTKYEPSSYGKERNLESYYVFAKVGFASEAELEPWARDQGVQAAFPEIQRDAQGQELKMLFIREGGEWLDYQTYSQGIDRNKIEAHRRAQMEKGEQEHRELLAELRRLPPPTEDEVKGLVRKRHEIGKHGLELPLPECVDLPGGEKFPADKNRMEDNPPRCFHLVQRTVKFIAFKLHVDGKYPKLTRFKYRIKLLYKTTPDLAKDTVLLSNWDELRGAVEHGKACEGDFGFDLKTRDKVSGSGSCWWAFDSNYENN